MTVPPVSVSLKKAFLVDLLRLRRVADEDDVDLAVVAGQEQVQQHEEALGEVFQLLRHRGRDVHQAEHDGLCRRPRHLVEAVELEVDRVDVGDRAAHVEDVRGAAPRSPRSGPSSGGRFACSASSSASSAFNSASDGRLSATRRAMELRMVRTRLSRAGGPSVTKPARTGFGDFMSLSRALMRLGASGPRRRCRGTRRARARRRNRPRPRRRDCPWSRARPPPPSRLLDLVADGVFAVARQHEVALAGIASRAEGRLL